MVVYPRYTGLWPFTSVGPLPPNVIPVIADLLDPVGLREALAELRNITHIVFGAYIEKASASETEVNVAILENLMEVIESESSSLRHVTRTQFSMRWEPA